MSQQRKAIKDKILAGRDRVSATLYLIYMVFLAVAIIVVVRLVDIHYRYSVPPGIEKYFRPRVVKRIDEPRRGDILACDGRILATSKPLYQIHMDCTVRKALYMEDSESGDSLECEWRRKALELSTGLSAIYGDKTGDEYYNLIISGREAGRQYVKIGYPIDHETYQKLLELPLFNEGQNKGGIITEKRDTRVYPYGGIARRTIGYVKNNSDDGQSKLIGIEGKYNKELHGVDGYEWLRITDKLRFVHDADSASVKAEDGMDIRTTIDIDLQDIADKAIRRQIEDDPQIGAACAVILDVKTGAIRAMVNLQRDTTAGSPLEERLNLVIGRVGEQGSVFKTVALTSLVEDGFVKNLNDSIPTNGGVVKGYPLDQHIRDYERETGRKHITVLHGFEISSNYVFTYLATKYYGDNPQKFFDHINTYHLSDKFDFDIPGLGTPQVTVPGDKLWSRTTLGTAAYGYSIAVTPLHVATFYNALAAGGKMMKPYLIEDFERGGKVIEKHGEANFGTICSAATADTLRRALLSVTEEGTARRLKGAKLQVAGKTGTAQVALSANENPVKGDAYHDKDGRKKNQGTFAGFFPANDPQYTVLVTIYSYLSKTSYYGGTSPALAVREIVDSIYALREDWSGSVTRTAQVPVMTAPAKDSLKGIPALKGMGLKDAVYLAENAGYKCEYEGCGHVASQSPAPGTQASRGTTIKIVLK